MTVSSLRAAILRAARARPSVHATESASQAGSTAPGLGFGEHGDGHVRIALVENNHRIRQALRGIRGFLQGDNVAPVEEVMAK